MMFEKYHERVVYASDEFYLTAKRKCPIMSSTVILTSLKTVRECVRSRKKEFIDDCGKREFGETDDKERHVSVATGVLAAPLIETLGKMLKTDFPNTVVDVYTIKTTFSGKLLPLPDL